LVVPRYYERLEEFVEYWAWVEIGVWTQALYALISQLLRLSRHQRLGLSQLWRGGGNQEAAYVVIAVKTVKLLLFWSAIDNATPG